MRQTFNFSERLSGKNIRSHAGAWERDLLFSRYQKQKNQHKGWFVKHSILGGVFSEFAAEVGDVYS